MLLPCQGELSEGLRGLEGKGINYAKINLMKTSTLDYLEMTKHDRETLNIISDAQRAIYELVDEKVGNNSYFLKEYIKTIAKYPDKFNIALLKSDKISPKIKAEYLLDNNRYFLSCYNNL